MQLRSQHCDHIAILFCFLQLQLFDRNKDGKLQLSEMAK